MSIGVLSLQGDVREHVESCEGCQAFTVAVAQDQLDLTGWMKGQVVPPPPPRIEFRRTPLHAASGYPRRVSLAIIPLMWGLILLVSLGVIAFGLGDIGILKDVGKVFRATNGNVNVVGARL